jgi:hypothetical protein
VTEPYEDDSEFSVDIVMVDPATGNLARSDGSAVITLSHENNFYVTSHNIAVQNDRIFVSLTETADESNSSDGFHQPAFFVYDWST